jgi:serine/threonine protein kinase
MSTPPKRAYVSEQSDAGIGIEEVQKLVSKMNFVSDRNTTATTSSSKKQQNIDEVVLISTTNETRARLEQLIKDIESLNSNKDTSKEEEEEEEDFVGIVRSISSSFLQFSIVELPKWSTLCARAIKILLKRTDFNNDDNNSNNETTRATTTTTTIDIEQMREKHRRNRRALLTLLLSFTRITSLYKKIKDEVKVDGGRSGLISRQSSLSQSSFSVGGAGGVRKKDIVGTDDPSTQKLTIECLKTCEKCETILEGVKMIQSCIALALILTSPQLNIGAGNYNNNYDNNNMDSLHSNNSDGTSRKSPTTRSFSQSAHQFSHSRGESSSGSEYEDMEKISSISGSSRENSASPSLRIATNSSSRGTMMSGYTHGSSPPDTPTASSRSLLGSSPLGHSQGSRITNENSRFAHNINAISSSADDADINTFGHRSRAVIAAGDGRVGRPGGVVRNPSRIFYRADLDRDDDSEDDYDIEAAAALKKAKQQSSRPKTTSVCRICEKTVQLTELVAHSACCATSPSSSPRTHKQQLYQHGRPRSMSPVDYLHTSSLSSSFDERMRVSELSRSLSTEKDDVSNFDGRNYKGGDININDNNNNNNNNNKAAHPRVSVEDFEVIKLISSGAHGRVFLAKKRATGDIYAIKAIKKRDLVFRNTISRLKEERDALVLAANPFVIKLFYAFSSARHVYFVTEYANGGDLYSLLKQFGYLEEDMARKYASEIVLALEYVHSVGVIHRDLKPENLLISSDGHLKLADFGLSSVGASRCDIVVQHSTSENIMRNNNSNNDNSRSNSPGSASLEATTIESRKMAVGTPDYLSPEVLLCDTDEISESVDFWSLGIIIYEMLCGVPPFHADTAADIFDNILAGYEAHNVRYTYPTEVSKEAKEIVQQLLHSEPDVRLGSNLLGGVNSVKTHAWFQEVDWYNGQTEANFVPNVLSIRDTSYFIKRSAQEDSSASPRQCHAESLTSSASAEVVGKSINLALEHGIDTSKAHIPKGERVSAIFSTYESGEEYDVVVDDLRNEEHFEDFNFINYAELARMNLLNEGSQQ